VVNMPEKRRKSKLRDLSIEEEWSLTIGGCWDSEFACDEDRRDAWERHRDDLLAESRAGTRPAAWWDYDATIPRPGGDDCQEPALYGAGLLSEAELAELMPQWREWYEQAQEPDFQYCIGTAKPGDTFGSWIKGAAAKRAQYKWAGIPRAIVKQWNAERRKKKAKRDA
jgi:hypothetical protein